jgi:flagellin-like hook-associated protein FlgL
MIRVRVLLVAMVACSTFAVAAGSAAASVPAASNTKFCKAAAKIGTNTSANPTQSEAKKTAAQFKAAAKQAPAKVKRALNQIASVLTTIGSVKNAKDLADVYTSSSFKNYTKAIGTYVSYYAANCIGTN